MKILDLANDSSNLIVSNVTFLYPQENIKLMFSDVLRGYRNVTLETNGLECIYYMTKFLKNTHFCTAAF